MGTQFANGRPCRSRTRSCGAAIVSHREGIEAAMVGTQLLGVRAAILARFAPLLLLSTRSAPPTASPASDPPGLRWTRVGQPVPPGEVPAVAVLGWAASACCSGPGRCGGSCACRSARSLAGWPACSGRTTRSTCRSVVRRWIGRRVAKAARGMSSVKTALHGRQSTTPGGVVHIGRYKRFGGCVQEVRLQRRQSVPCAARSRPRRRSIISTRSRRTCLLEQRPGAGSTAGLPRYGRREASPVPADALTVRA